MTRISFRLLACAALLAAPLAFTTPASAADIDDEIQAAAPAQGSQAHEQWEQLRAEHQQLVAERDRLMERCMDVKGQDRSACDQKWDNLRARHEDWRQRMVAFHDQASSKHENMHWHHKKGMKHEHHEHKADNAAHAAPNDGKMHHHHHHHHDMKSQNATPAPDGDKSGQ